MTGQRSNQLNYDPAFGYIGLAENPCRCLVIGSLSDGGVTAVPVRDKTIVTEEMAYGRCGARRDAISFMDLCGISAEAVLLDWPRAQAHRQCG